MVDPTPVGARELQCVVEVKGRVLGILGLSYHLWSVFFVEGSAVTDVFKAQDQTYALHMS